MSLCVVCGYSTLDSNDICTHHTASYAVDWAIGNRLMCDLLHRGIVSTPASRDMLVYAPTPDLDNAAERVSFGTSGHRGSSLRGSFTEAHILAITQAICDYRRGQGIDGPLHMGKDTHALSRPAERTALEVLAANERDHDRPARRRCDADAGHLPRHRRRKPRPPHRARRRHRRHAVAQPAAKRSCARLRRSSTDHSDRDPMLKRVVV